MSKKYKEVVDKIVMNDDMKKRILQNVLAANENNEEKNIKVETFVPKVKKYNNIKRNMQIAAAGFAVVVCLSVAKNYPMLLKNTSNDLKQNESAKSQDDENSDLKTNDDNESVYNKNSKETSNSDNKEEQALNQNNNIHDNDNSFEKEESNDSTNIEKEENKDKLQANSGSEIVKSKPSQNNDGKAIGNPNISLKTNPKEDVNNKKDKNAESTEAKERHGDIMLDKAPKNNDDNNVSSTAVMDEKSVNSNQQYKTLDEAEKALNLKVDQLKTLPKDFKMESISAISNETIQVEYNDGNSNITFRAGKSTDNINDDDNIYQVKKTVKVSGLNVNLEGNKNEEYNLAVWEKDGISYSISAENGIDEKTLLNMIF